MRRRKATAAEQDGFLSGRTLWHTRAKLAILTWPSALRRGCSRPEAFIFQSQMPAHP